MIDEEKVTERVIGEHHRQADVCTVTFSVCVSSPLGTEKGSKKSLTDCTLSQGLRRRKTCRYSTLHYVRVE